MVTERVSLLGHLIDENSLGRVFAIFDRHGVEFRVRRFRIGEKAESPSLIELTLRAPTSQALDAALRECEPYSEEFTLDPVQTETVDVPGVWPEGFYSTTNFPTFVYHEGQWVEVERIEMDVAIRIFADAGKWRAETCPMHQTRVGDRIVVGYEGVRVIPQETPEEDGEDFRFMGNDVSTERPKSRLIRHCAEAIAAAHRDGKRVLLVGGPAIVHSGCADELARLIRGGFIDVLFAGNALAAHDIEASMLGTSLGVSLEKGHAVTHGHTHHLRCINRVRRAGSIRAAVEQGIIPSGAMRAAVEVGIPFVLCGSIRDDGPLPDVITDNVEAQDAMRAHAQNVGVAIMVATTLHSVATGNLLPAAVTTYCVDSDADTVIKLTDRGTHQAIGIVTDCEFFLKELTRQLGA